eukprot:jgi/Tetstr1/438371/TSEL_026937.t1
MRKNRLLRGRGGDPAARHLRGRSARWSFELRCIKVTAKLFSSAQSITVPMSLANGGGQPRMPLMEIAKRYVKHEPVEDGLEKHTSPRALESKRVTISMMEAY